MGSCFTREKTWVVYRNADRAVVFRVKNLGEEHGRHFFQETMHDITLGTPALAGDASVGMNIYFGKEREPRWVIEALTRTDGSIFCVRMIRGDPPKDFEPPLGWVASDDGRSWSVDNALV